MTTAVAADRVLARLRETLGDMYGDRIDRVVLFGSRARGDSRPDSDYDVAVFLHDMDDRFAEMDRLANLSTDLIAEPASSSTRCLTGRGHTTTGHR